MPRSIADSRRGRGALLALLASLSAIGGGLALPVQSSAATIDFSVHGSRGYTISVSGSPRRVTLFAGGPAGTAAYTVPGRATRRRVRANLGRLGRVDVTFRPGSRMEIETPPNRCEGKPRVTRWGAFVGTIRFRGERRFTRVRARRATGRVRVRPIWRCRRRRRVARGSTAGARATASAGELTGPVTLEFADRRHRVAGGVLAIGRGGEFSLTAFFAHTRERRGRMRIARTAFELGQNRDFSYDESLTEATVTPPRPFAGRGVFRRRPSGAVSWTGSLSVLLPGARRISLVGRRFTARLYSKGSLFRH